MDAKDLKTIKVKGEYLLQNCSLISVVRVCVRAHTHIYIHGKDRLQSEQVPLELEG